ncbi:MAG TPA: 2-oxoacid:acceptor oxidoreductase family protein [Frankiaceae bacterium]|nr:2-oxoacid:acceptor oxidoreductase family protein [Frankiaceae bacterium]
MERELLMTGIGGQGVQLAAQLLAKAATRFGRYAQLFGSYGGMMRGGNTDATLIIGQQPVQAPPMVGSAWSAIVMHHEFAVPTLERLRAEGVLVLNTSVVTDALLPPVPAGVRTAAIPASELAIELGSPAAATMVALGAYAAVTRILDIEELVETLPEALPSYRRQHVAGNARALRAGADAAAGYGIIEAAWPVAAAAQP